MISDMVARMFVQLAKKASRLSIPVFLKLMSVRFRVAAFPFATDLQPIFSMCDFIYYE